MDKIIECLHGYQPHECPTCSNEKAPYNKPPACEGCIERGECKDFCGVYRVKCPWKPKEPMVGQLKLLKHYIKEQLRIDNIQECQAKYMLDVIKKIIGEM